jgi:hypothetical protein
LRNSADGKFGIRLLNPDKLRNWNQLPIEKGESVWVREPAADHFTNYLKRAILTLYTNQNKLLFLISGSLYRTKKEMCNYVKIFLER